MKFWLMMFVFVVILKVLSDNILGILYSVACVFLLTNSWTILWLLQDCIKTIRFYLHIKNDKKTSSSFLLFCFPFIKFYIHIIIIIQALSLKEKIRTWIYRCAKTIRRRVYVSIQEDSTMTVCSSVILMSTFA